MCVYLQMFLCMWKIWRILYNLNYFSIMAKHTDDESVFHYAQQSNWIDKNLVIWMKCVPSGAKVWFW